MLKKPLTPEEYVASCAICRETSEGTKFRHRRTGNQVEVVDTETGVHFPYLTLLPLNRRNPRRFTTRALNFKRDYQLLELATGSN